MNKIIALFASMTLATSVVAAPKLILQITVDQLRADLPYRYQGQFLNGDMQTGFNQFLKHGITFNNNHYRHAATKTAVGHATLATGALPSQHGVIGNGWYDVTTNQPMYCVADKDSSLLGDEGHSASPKNLSASTFSDELFSATQGTARIAAVSIKDRGAVLTAGHYGKAFWYNKKTGNMVTSDYYYPAQPVWLDKFNHSGAKDRYIAQQWKRLLPVNDYVNNQQNRIYQIPPKGFTQGFPHQLSKQANSAYYGSLPYTPYGDKLTAEFAKTLISQFEMGQDDVTDYLSVSFSVNDYVGHMFGPYSQEAEDNLLQLDRTLADLFEFIDKKIGLNNVLIALSADHGVDSIPEYKKAQGFPAMRGNLSASIEHIEKQAQQHFKTSAQLVQAVVTPDIYLNKQSIAEEGLNQKEVENYFAHHIKALKLVDSVFFARNLKDQKPSTDPIVTKVNHSFFAPRSGDLVLVLRKSSLPSSGTAASHGSPYNYDTHVPLYFSGMSLQPAQYYFSTSPEDLATTLSAVLNINQPDKATGKVLSQIPLGDDNKLSN